MGRISSLNEQSTALRNATQLTYNYTDSIMDVLLKVLLVENSEVISSQLIQFLENNGYSLKCQAIDTSEAMIHELTTDVWDVVLIDYDLPKFPGMTALKIIKEKFPETPTIMLSEKENAEIIVNAIQAGANDFIIKGNYSRLIDSINKQLKRSGLRQVNKITRFSPNESEEKYRLLVENSLVGIYITQNHILKYANQKLAEIFGYESYHEIIGKHVEVLVAAESWELVDNEVKKRESGQKEYSQYEFTGVKKDGTKFDIEVLGTRILYQDQPAIQGILIDITERKQAQLQIQILNEELEQRVKERTRELEAVNHELESFNYSVSHDLKAPLRAIDGFACALLEEYSEFPPPGQDYLTKIRRSAQKLGTLIDDLLQFTRLTQIEISVKKLNMSTLVRKIATELIESHPEKNIKFNIIPNVYAFGDARLINLVLKNLLNNAVKFSLHKSISKIEFGAILKNHQQVYFIRDNGIGFNMEYHDKLFGVFHRLHNDQENSGTGIGLSIVRRIIDKHKGKIWAESEENNGATFYFTFST